jgi:hypothetical protein
VKGASIKIFSSEGHIPQQLSLYPLQLEVPDESIDLQVPCHLKILSQLAEHLKRDDMSDPKHAVFNDLLILLC